MGGQGLALLLLQLEFLHDNEKQLNNTFTALGWRQRCCSEVHFEHVLHTVMKPRLQRTVEPSPVQQHNFGSVISVKQRVIRDFHLVFFLVFENCFYLGETCTNGPYLSHLCTETALNMTLLTLHAVSPYKNV